MILLKGVINGNLQYTYIGGKRDAELKLLFVLRLLSCRPATVF